jgi:hypothetical protein
MAEVVLVMVLGDPDGESIQGNRETHSLTEEEPQIQYGNTTS